MNTYVDDYHHPSAPLTLLPQRRPPVSDDGRMALPAVDLLNLSPVPNLDIALKNGEHKIVLISDHVASPADFILHRVLSQCLKSSSTALTTIISLEREFAQWSAIAAKSNIQLSKHLNDGSLAYIDGLSVSSSPPLGSSAQELNMGEGYHTAPSAFQSTDAITLKGLYSTLERTLQKRQSQPHVLILDSPCILDFIGVPSLDITRFIRAVAGLYRSNALSSIIFVRDHITCPPSETSTPFDAPVLRLLVSISHVHVEVRSLRTGRSGAISGEVSLHPGGAGGSMVKGQGGRMAAVQYKLTDSGAVFFQRGMSKGVL